MATSPAGDDRRSATRSRSEGIDPLGTRGVLAGPFYLTVSLAQALTRAGFGWSVLGARVAVVHGWTWLPAASARGARP